MERGIEKQVSDDSYAMVGNSVGRAENPADVMRDTRQRFMAAFPEQCETLTTLSGVTEPSSTVDAINLLHRMAGLGGTLGFTRVSAKAVMFEDALRASKMTASELPEAVSALRTAFEQDVAEPPAAPVDVTPVANSLTVLLVEDEPVQRAMISAQLKKAGYLPVEASSGEQAVSVARQVKPDVILLDVELPGINGHAVCRLMKADPELAAIPVAFLSAHAGLDDRLMGLSFGADDFLTKPIDPRELALRVQLLGTRRGTSPGRGNRDVLSYDAFCAAAREELQRQMVALAFIRTPSDRSDEVAACVRDEIRRRDLCGQYDRTHLLVLLPETGGPATRDRIASIVEKCRAAGMSGVYAGVAASPFGGARTFDDLLEEADEALAIARYEELPAALRPEGPRGAARAQTVAPMIVVGDDDPDVVRIVDSHLAAGGYRRALAFDGVRTLEQVKSEQPDVLVVDLMMPRMTGFDVLAGLRELGDSRPRVIVLSARGREEDVIRAFSLGADDYMAKPFNPQELLARIARLLK